MTELKDLIEAHRHIGLRYCLQELAAELTRSHIRERHRVD